MQAKTFNRTTLRQALHELGRRARTAGKTIEIAIYGGSALMLTYDWRLATRDVDAVFEADRAIIRRLAAEIGEENGWERDWLNDGVKGFLSALDADPESRRLFGTYPSERKPGLRVMIANPRYLFAMKCRAMRLGGVEASEDVADIRGLAREIGIAGAAEALDLVEAFYPNHLIEPKTRFGLEEMFGAPGVGMRSGAGADTP